jgi:fructoselysine-6-P-deglycase FrlB-like protein
VEVVLGEGVDDVLVRSGEAIAAYLATARARIDAIKAAIGLPERLFILGRGPSLSMADYGALVSKEAAKRPVESLGAAEFRLNGVPVGPEL